MEDHYEINVSLHGKHFFATAPRSCRTDKDMREVLNELAERFPVKDGFQISVTRWECRGTVVFGASP